MPELGTANRIITLFSSFIMELNNVKNADEIMSALLKIVKKTSDAKWIVIMDDKENVLVSHPKDFNLDSERFSDLIEWALENRTHSFYPIGDEILGLLPMVKGDQVLGIIVVGLESEPKVEEIDTLRVFSFLSATVAENVRLIEEVMNKNRLIEETMNYLHSILDTFPEMVIVVSGEGEIVYMNRRFVEEGDVEGLKDKALEVAKQVIETKVRKVGEYESNGHFFSIVAEPLRYGNTYQAVTTIVNVTSTKELERLKELDRMKTEFVANISHELRTPLAAIKAYSETILDSLDMLDQETLRDFMDTVYKESIHLENLLNELLDFSRIEQKALKLNKEEVDIISIVKDAMESMTEYAKSNGVRLELETDLEELKVYVDPKRMRQVLLNLISNGIKYSKKDSEDRYVKIKVEAGLENFVIVVEDNGIGIPHDKREKIFEKFYRVDSSLTYEISGTGLGLAIVKEIVEMHGGKIWVESEEGVGSKFYIEMPIKREE